MGTTGQSITLANSIIGVGILAMPFCFQQCGVVLATLILIVMGLVSRLCCHFLLKSALIARRRNFEFLAFHVFGSAGKLAVEVGIIGFLMGTCIAYFVVVGDLGPQIISKMFNINQSDILRTCIMVVVSVVCVLPLGLLRNVDSLSNVSAATIGFYLCLVIKVVAEAGSELWWRWPALRLWRPDGVLQCVPIFSMALFCQTQLFEIFESMPSLSLEKMSVVTKNAINICTGVYFTLGLFGYVAFNQQNISGNILMSLSPTKASDVIKLGFVMSLAFSFPLIIFPCRASLYSLLYKKVHSSHHDHLIHPAIPLASFRCLTVCIVAASLAASLLLPNVELVLGLLGSTVGVCICLIFPAAAFVHVTFKDTNERILAKGVLMLGLIIMVLGTYANLQAAESARARDEAITPDRIDQIVQDFFHSRAENTAGIHKPLPEDEHPLQEVKNGQESIKDSEKQPPNPVPPESHSNEKIDQAVREPPANDDAVKKEKPQLANAMAEPDKSEKNHKNIKLIPENGVNAPNIEKIEKIEQIKNAEAENQLRNFVVESQPKVPEVEIQPKHEKKVDKIDEMKNQQIMKNIEEQKELMKEQKEIIDEMKKLKLNKKEEDVNEEAKKIAVESIQQIAKVAIQSLSGVSDKPSAKEEDVKDEPLAKIAKEAVQELAHEARKIDNEAVQEIAKKAVESIVAINEIKEKPREILEVKGIPQKTEESKPLPVHIDTVNKILHQIAINPAPEKPVNIEPVINNHIPNIQLVAENINQNSQNNLNAQVVPNHQKNVVDNVIANEQNVNHLNAQPVPNKQKGIETIVVENVITKQHSHAPDEPQSYKQGEDSQLHKVVPDKPVREPMQSRPIAMALNENTQLYSKVEAKAVANSNIVVQSQSVQNIDVNQAQNRRKREVDDIDCKENRITNENRVICETILKHDSQELLPDVNLNDLVSRNLQLDSAIVGRSLKSVDEGSDR